MAQPAAARPRGRRAVRPPPGQHVQGADAPAVSGHLLLLHLGPAHRPPAGAARERRMTLLAGAIVAALTCAASLGLLLARFRHRLPLDQPNARSLHETPVPRVG